MSSPVSYTEGLTHPVEPAAALFIFSSALLAIFTLVKSACKKQSPLVRPDIIDKLPNWIELLIFLFYACKVRL